MSKLIPLESLKAFLKSRRFTEEKNGWYVLSLSPTVVDELDALATIDPLAIIDEIIQDDMFISENKEYPLLLNIKERLSLTK